MMPSYFASLEVIELYLIIQFNYLGEHLHHKDFIHLNKSFKFHFAWTVIVLPFNVNGTLLFSIPVNVLY